MNAEDTFTDNHLHAFIDDQLCRKERARLLRAMDSNPKLRERVTSLQMTKEWVTLAFTDERSAPRPLPVMPGRMRLGLIATAASFMLIGLGFLLGHFTFVPANPMKAVSIQDVVASDYKVLLHIDRSDDESIEVVLDNAERLLHQYAAFEIQVDVLANAGGIDMLRVDVSPAAKRIAQLMRDHDNIRFIACTNALQRLQEKGITPILIEQTRHDTTAIEHIIERLQTGWTYLRV